jgi:hypothetical protein
MYQKIYYPHKIIYSLVLMLRDPNILLLTLLFVYTSPLHQNMASMTRTFYNYVLILVM